MCLTVAGYEILTAVTMKSTVTPCDLVQVHQYLAGTSCLNLHGQCPAYSDDEGKYVFPKRR
jgi:hypothetical protein